MSGSHHRTASTPPYLAPSDLEQDESTTSNSALLAKNTVFENWQNQYTLSEDSTADSIPQSTLNFDRISHTEAGNKNNGQSSPYGDLLYEPATFSMFRHSEFANESTAFRGSDGTYSLRDEHSASCCPDDNFQIPTGLMPSNLAAVPSTSPYAAAQAVSTNTAQNRFQCTHPSCDADFHRVGDLRRHQRAHGAPAYPCTVNGCVRRGSNAFHRRDKLLDHMRKKHGLAV